MTRSFWKGFFLDYSVVRQYENLLLISFLIFKKQFSLSNTNNFFNIIKTNKPLVLQISQTLSEIYPIKIWSRRSIISPFFLGFVFLIHNGQIFRKVKIKNNMIRHKFGEFSYTKKMGYKIHLIKNKKKIKKKKKR